MRVLMECMAHPVATIVRGITFREPITAEPIPRAVRNHGAAARYSREEPGSAVTHGFQFTDWTTDTEISSGTLAPQLPCQTGAVPSPF